MSKRLKSTVARVRRIRAKTRALAEKRSEFHFGFQSVIRELTELARRSIRRRRHGDRHLRPD